MPIYEYGCPKCGEFECRQSLHDQPLKRCPTCKSKVTKLISSSAFQLKGGGWYSDAYQKKASSSGTSPSTSTDTSTSTTSTTPSVPAAGTSTDKGSSGPASSSE